ncbi:MAG: hypothetical protein NTU47_10570 [Ignavibacteriales bacterium]|nr:hypothetical protein [Ignavibacteriales bacterium]
MKSIRLTILVFVMVTQAVLAQGAGAPKFGDDVAFLKKHVDVIVLSDKSSSTQVAVIPSYQCRVMTSTTGGSDGLSYGWVNRDLISSGKTQPHINVFGGEDRFWIGPEGGQFSVFFKKGDAFDLEHWFTPASIDTEPFELVSKSSDRVVCRKSIQLTNYSGTTFDLVVNREISLLDTKSAQKYLGVSLKPGVRVVAYESVNSVRNTGTNLWTKEGGLLSIWILGMFNASPATTIAIPYVKGDETKLGPVVNDSYFGKVPADRLVVKDGMIYFAADANYRSKIGIPPLRTKPMLGSYDAVNKVLTLVQFTFPKGAVDYVNSMWEVQKKPFGGDVVNSYNDGPPKPGAAQLGRFYELETSSQALALKPNASGTHVSRTMHLQGPEPELDAIARATLGVGLDQIKNGLKK